MAPCIDIRFEVFNFSAKADFMMKLIIHPNAEKVLSRLPVRDSEAIKAKLKI